MTKRIDGKARADRLVADVAAAAATLKAAAGFAPGLCAVLVGDDPASQVYVRNKGKAATAAGHQQLSEHLPASASEAELLALIARLNADDRVDGILVQLPLPKQIDPQRVIDAIDPARTSTASTRSMSAVCGAADGAARWCRARPMAACCCCATNCPNLAGAEAVVLGRSNIVGKPMAALLLAENCTVTLAHSRTRDLPTLLAPRRYPGGGGRPAGIGARRLDQAGRHRHRCRHQPRRRPRMANRSSSATSPLPKRKASPARSRRCRAASGR